MTRVVEVAGPAGAGKTSLCQALQHQSTSVQLDNFPNVRKLSDAPFFIVNGLQLIPSLLRLEQSGSRRLTRREFAWMSILNGWSALLRRKAALDGKVTLLDQGPVYLLAEMRLFGPAYLKQSAAEHFWQTLFHRWEAALHTIFYLDADDEILFDRIRSREQEHIVKSESEAAVRNFLNRYRAEYEFILSTLTTKDHSLRVLRLDTGNRQPQELAAQVLTELA